MPCVIGKSLASTQTLKQMLTLKQNKTKPNQTKLISSQPLNLNPTTAKTQNCSMYATGNINTDF